MVSPVCGLSRSVKLGVLNELIPFAVDFFFFFCWHFGTSRFALIGLRVSHNMIGLPARGFWVLRVMLGHEI